MSQNTITLESLVGPHILTGVDRGSGDETDIAANCLRFTLDGVTYIAKEDPSDGYRSYLDAMEIVDGLTQHPLPDVLVTARMRTAEDSDILELIDDHSGEVVLAVGTRDVSDYYPVCVLDWLPENLAINSK